jgi:cellulose synthase/poly-beta-1,6-N-acetylglucosamine synthase-like glycosyltransferase
VDMMILVIVAAILVGLPGLIASAHLGLVALASLAYRASRPGPHQRARFLVLIPAHNEARVIGRCLEAINAGRRPEDLVLVVADRCTDATGRIARAAGARVLERGPADEPGRAAARQAGLEHARGLQWDAVVMVDADSVVAPGFFPACERTLASGAVAAQARSEGRSGRTLADEAALAAFTLQGITIPRGRDRLGASVRLRGTGMVIRRDAVLGRRFHAPASEDLVYTLDLLLEGIRCRHIDDARLRSEGAGTWSSFGGQKVRYEAGRMAAAKVYLVPLLKRGIRHLDGACLEAAWFLATPPFAVAVLSLLAGLALAVVAQAWPLAAVLGGGMLAMALVLVTGLIQARVGPRTWLALLVAPWYVGWKAVVQLRAAASVIRRDDYFPPTARA